MSRSQARHHGQPSRRNMTSSAASAMDAHRTSRSANAAIRPKVRRSSRRSVNQHNRLFLPHAAGSAYYLHETECKEISMPSRRTFLTGAAAWSMVGAPRVRAEAVLTDDGLLRQPWFLDSLLELPDDLSAATQSGKRLAVIWELRGCPYCRKTHMINFAQPEIESYVRQHFEVLQLNIIGAREVTD